MTDEYTAQAVDGVGPMAGIGVCILSLMAGMYFCMLFIDSGMDSRMALPLGILIGVVMMTSTSLVFIYLNRRM